MTKPGGLTRVGVGLCLTPPPLAPRGDVGISIFPTTGDESLATINGHIVYTNFYPWTLEIGGTVSVLDNQVGTGSVLIDGWGDFAFDLWPRECARRARSAPWSSPTPSRRARPCA